MLFSEHLDQERVSNVLLEVQFSKVWQMQLVTDKTSMISFQHLCLFFFN